MINVPITGGEVVSGQVSSMSWQQSPKSRQPESQKQSLIGCPTHMNPVQHSVYPASAHEPIVGTNDCI